MILDDTLFYYIFNLINVLLVLCWITMFICSLIMFCDTIKDKEKGWQSIHLFAMMIGCVALIYLFIFGV